MTDNYLDRENQRMFATDDIDGIHYHRDKLTVGRSGSAVDVSDLNPLPTVDSTSNLIEQALCSILYELRMIRVHLAGVTGLSPRQSDFED